MCGAARDAHDNDDGPWHSSCHGHHVFWADVCRPRGWAARLADRPAAIAGCAYRPSGGRSVTPQWQSRPFPAVQFPPVVVPPLPLLSGSSVVGFLAVTEMVLPLSTCVPAADLAFR